MAAKKNTEQNPPRNGAKHRRFASGEGPPARGGTDLQGTRDNLEKRVKGRSSELVEVNRKLRDEIREREKAERNLTRWAKIETALSDLKERLLRPSSCAKKFSLITDAVVSEFKADFCRIWMIRPGDLCDTCMHKSATRLKTIPKPDSKKFLKMVGDGLHDCIYRDRCLHLVASSGRYTHLDGGVHKRIPFGCYKIGRVAAEIDKGFLTNNVQKDPRVHNRDWARELGLTSFAGYRLTSSDGKPLGVLALFSKHEISPQEELLLEDVASTTSHVILAESAEEALRASEEQYRNLYETAPVGLFRTRISDGKILQANRTGAKIMGFRDAEELAKSGVSIAEYYPAERRMELLRQLKDKGEISDFEAHFIFPDGTERDIALSAKIYPEKGYIEGVGVDITERRRLEEQLRHIQKMEAVGTLAGGIAHDFNNILAGILGYASLIKDQLPKGSSLASDLESINELGWRGADLTKALLAFARKGVFHPEPVSVNRVIENVLKVVERTMGKNVSIKRDLPGDTLNISGDRGQLHQIVMNLCINACEAMPERGILTVRTGNAERDRKFFKEHPTLKKGRCVAVCITDTGTGIEEEDFPHIFDPFFTTKSDRTGTGLGLSVVNGIVERHGGCIEVESFPGKGSSFTIYLPATGFEEKIPAREEKASLKGDETILVVDDEKDFRETVGRWLGEFGYSVIKAESGEKALEILNDRVEQIDLVLLDVIMKGIGGVKTFKSIRKMAPPLPVVVCSGFSLDTTYKHILRDEANGFIQKPFEKKALLAKVRELFDAIMEKEVANG